MKWALCLLLLVPGPGGAQPPEQVNPYTFHRKVGLWGAMFAWAATGTGAAMMNDQSATTLVPVIGPWLRMVEIEGDDDTGYADGGKGLLMVSGFVQAGLLAYGIVSAVRESEYGRDNPTIHADGRHIGIAFTIP